MNVPLCCATESGVVSRFLVADLEWIAYATALSIEHGCYAELDARGAAAMEILHMVE